MPDNANQHLSELQIRPTSNSSKSTKTAQKLKSFCKRLDWQCPALYRTGTCPRIYVQGNCSRSWNENGIGCGKTGDDFNFKKCDVKFLGALLLVLVPAEGEIGRLNYPLKNSGVLSESAMGDEANWAVTILNSLRLYGPKKKFGDLWWLLRTSRFLGNIPNFFFGKYRSTQFVTLSQC